MDLIAFKKMIEDLELFPLDARHWKGKLSDIEEER